MNKAARKSEWAVVTGASGGLGKEFARLLAADGYNIVLVARGKQELSLFATDLRKSSFVQVKVYDGDLSKNLVVKGLHDFCTKNKLSVSILINNAGVGDYAPLLGADWKRLKNMMQLNMFALAELTYLFAADMAKNGGGKIMNVASTAAFLSGPNMATYYATKAFVLHFSEAIDYEMRSSNVSVTTFCPGPTDTGFAKQAQAEGSRIFRTKLPGAASVAAHGYQGLKEGKRVVVEGFWYRIVLRFISLFPRTKVLEKVVKIQG